MCAKIFFLTKIPDEKESSAPVTYVCMPLKVSQDLCLQAPPVWNSYLALMGARIE